MTYPNKKLLNLLNKTISSLQNENEKYNWGHFGRCNCGYLAKELTNKSPKEIHEAALEKKGLDWGVRVENFCPVSGYLIDDIISDLFKVGLTPSDLVSLERLDNPKVLEFLEGEKNLRKGSRKDAISYMKAFRNYVSHELEKNKVKV